MKIDGVLGHHRHLTDKARKLIEDKNKDYSGKDGEDPFKNFRLCENLSICSSQQGIVVRMLDKVSRLSNLTKHDSFVENESFDDTIVDLINYAVLLSALRQDESPTAF